MIKWNEILWRFFFLVEEMYEKWIVIIIINVLIDDVKKLVDIEGWKVVVVGDIKILIDWRYVV